MSDTIESRTLYGPDANGVSIHGRMVADEYADPTTDGDWVSPADIEAWRNDDWQYVGMLVEVHMDGYTIGEGALWAVVHGTLGEQPAGEQQEGERIEADAWEITVAEYGTHVDPSTGITHPTTTAGSSLNSVIVESLVAARAHIARLKGDTSILAAAVKWADPNA